MLNNSRHEAFARGRAAGKSVGAAYREAGYSPNSGNASRLNGNERVIARVGELKALIQNMKNLSIQRGVLSSDWVMEQLVGVVNKARAQGKAGQRRRQQSSASSWPAIVDVCRAEGNRQAGRV